MITERLKRHCVLCTHSRLSPGCVLMCETDIRILTTVHARSDSGDCGPEGVMFEKKKDDCSHAD